jgi:hypothetical protein
MLVHHTLSPRASNQLMARTTMLTARSTCHDCCFDRYMDAIIMPQFNGGARSTSPIDSDTSGTHRVVPHRDIESPSERALRNPASDQYASIDGAPKPWSGEPPLSRFEARCASIVAYLVRACMLACLFQRDSWHVIVCDGMQIVPHKRSSTC